MKPEIMVVAAMDQKRGIGRDGKIPWPRIPEDMQRFKDETVGHPVIMGRKTYESIPPKFRPLIDRQNIIVTRNPNLEFLGCSVAGSIEEALELASILKPTRTCIIGGGQIYQQALDLADRLYLTLIGGDFGCDTFFPDYGDFSKVVYEKDGESNGVKYKFITLVKD